VFDHNGDWRGAIALVGSTQAIPEVPSPEQLALVTAAAVAASRNLGWEPRP
jgi:DNA-binding IclR family transcriptional regulator